MIEEKRFAVLIDCENISPKYIGTIMDEMSKLGTVTIKRVYGDWTSTCLSSWKETLANYALNPIQQFSNTKGKNSTDSAMIIDAMDILYKDSIDGFCLCTSDSDFTKLACRLKESGMDIIGMGEVKTPDSFVNACNTFKYLDKIGNEKQVSQNDPDVREKIEFINKRLSESESGEIRLCDLGNDLVKVYPYFDSRNYSSPKLSALLKEWGFVVSNSGEKMSVSLNKGNPKQKKHN